MPKLLHNIMANFCNLEQPLETDICVSVILALVGVDYEQLDLVSIFIKLYFLKLPVYTSEALVRIRKLFYHRKNSMKYLRKSIFIVLPSNMGCEGETVKTGIQ